MSINWGHKVEMDGEGRLPELLPSRTSRGTQNGVDSIKCLTAASCRYSTGGLVKSKSDLLQGTLDMLIPKTLALEPLHRWDISQRIQ